MVNKATYAFPPEEHPIKRFSSKVNLAKAPSSSIPMLSKSIPMLSKSIPFAAVLNQYFVPHATIQSESVACGSINFL